MNTILFELKEFRPTVTIVDLAKYIGRDKDVLRSQIDRCRVNLTDEEKKLMLEWIEKRIRKLVKIKVLIDKEVEWV